MKKHFPTLLAAIILVFGALGCGSSNTVSTTYEEKGSITRMTVRDRLNTERSGPFVRVNLLVEGSSPNSALVESVAGVDGSSQLELQGPFHIFRNSERVVFARSTYHDYDRQPLPAGHIRLGRMDENGVLSLDPSFLFGTLRRWSYEPGFVDRNLHDATRESGFIATIRGLRHPIVNR